MKTPSNSPDELPRDGEWVKELDPGAHRHRPQAEPLATHVIVDASRGGAGCELLFYEEQLYFSSIDLLVSRSELVRRSVFFTGSTGVSLLFREPRRAFKLPIETIVTLRVWLEPIMTELVEADLRRRFRYSLPLGLYFLITSTWKATQASAVLGLSVGFGFLGLTLLGMVRPFRELLLVECLVWILLAARFGLQLQERGDPLLGIPIVLAFVFVRAAWRRFRFFRSQTPVSLD